MVVLLLLTACVSKDKRKHIPTGSSDTSFVSLDEQQRAPQMRLTEDLRIDAVREDLAPIGPLVVRADSSIAFAQDFDSKVRFYSSAEKRLANVGFIQRMVARLPLGDETFLRLPNCAHSVPYAHDPLWSIAQDGKYMAFLNTDLTSRHAGLVRISLLSGMGDTLFARNLEFEGIPIPRANVDSAINMAVRALRDNNSCSSSSGNAASIYDREVRAKIPPVYAPVNGLLIGHDGTTWIALRRNGDRRPYLVLDEKGTPLGRFALPRTARIEAADRNRIWVVEYDVNDVGSIVRYKVGWSP